MQKVTVQKGNAWGERSVSRTFSRQIVSAGIERLGIALPRDGSDVFRQLAAYMPAPFFVLYILHTPRGEGAPGRYQSEQIDQSTLQAFLGRFGRFLACDARHDIWVKSCNSNDLIVWDRHDDVFAYGDLARFAEQLRALGFEEGPIQPLGVHQHHYRSEFDEDARQVLGAFDWYRTELRPEDEQ